jgi:hypothetical protein
MLLTIAQVLATIFVGATFVVYWHQLKVMRQAAEGQSLLSLVQYLQAPHLREARRCVLAHLRGRQVSTWTDEERSAASAVASSYDIAAIIIKSGLVYAEIFLDNWGPSIVRCHEVVALHVRDLRKSMGDRYWNDFDWLYAQVQSRFPVLPLTTAEPDSTTPSGA